MKSSIALSGFNQSTYDDNGSTEEIVTSSKLLQLDLRGTELVFFSACNTGLGDIKGSPVSSVEQKYLLLGFLIAI